MVHVTTPVSLASVGLSGKSAKIPHCLLILYPAPKFGVSEPGPVGPVVVVLRRVFATVASRESSKLISWRRQLQVECYVACAGENPSEELFVHFRHIVDMYIVEGSMLEININTVMRKKVLEVRWLHL